MADAPQLMRIAHYKRFKIVKMKMRKLIYWTTTGLVCAVMIFSVFSFTVFDYYMYPEGAFVHLGLPEYFKVELTVAKILGILALLIPGVAPKIKEFAYFGFGITLLSASIAHFATGDGILYIIDPLIFLGILVISYRYYHKLWATEQ
jgi:hypothetical protein